MIPWDVQVPQSVEDSCTITLHPGGTSGVELKLKFSYSWLQANNSVLIQDRQSILRVMTTCLTNCFHCWLAGKLSSIPYISLFVWKRGTRNYCWKISKFGLLSQKITLDIWQKLMSFVYQSDDLSCYNNVVKHGANHFSYYKNIILTIYNYAFMH